MHKRSWIYGGVAIAMLAVLAAGAMLWVSGPVQTAQAASLAQEVEAEPAAGEAYALSYAAKFVCTEALQPGVIHLGPAAPLVQQKVQQKTDVLVHNPSRYPVTFYKKAVIAPLEQFGQVDQNDPLGNPGKYYRVRLDADRAFRIDCDDIAKLLTGKADATFIGTYGVGVTVEGFVVIITGPQDIDGTNRKRYSPLDVTAEYVRSSEVMKKDIHYQPWWWYWPTSLPWRLGYAYQRVLPLTTEQLQQNIDCRGALTDALRADVDRENPSGAQQVHQALDAGANIMEQDAATNQALVPLIGRCDKVSVGTGLAMSVDYVLVSTVSPLSGYPWRVGRWNDLALVVPQNRDVDLDQLMRNWMRWPSLRLLAEPDKCVHCLTCSRGCPMSLDVHAMVERTDMEDNECILCGTCVDGCDKAAIRYTFSAG